MHVVVGDRSAVDVIDEQSAIDWHQEPTLEEVFSDPIVECLLVRDRLRVEDVRALMAAAARRLLAVKESALPSLPSHAAAA